MCLQWTSFPYTQVEAYRALKAKYFLSFPNPVFGYTLHFPKIFFQLLIFLGLS